MTPITGCVLNRFMGQEDGTERTCTIDSRFKTVGGSNAALWMLAVVKPQR